MGGKLPISTFVFPFVCVCGVNVGNLLCGTRVLSSVSARLCGARVLDDVRREAQAGQRTRKARSQVLPGKFKL